MWKYYNYAMIPDCPPHEEAQISLLKDKKNTKPGGYWLFARWTSEFDCGHVTNWWYCIKDTPFDVATLPSKKRYEINKGKKNFIVKIIEPVEFIDEILNVQQKAWLEYPEAYRPEFDQEKSKRDIRKWGNYRVFGAFSNEDNRLCAYACLKEYTEWVDFMVLKALPEYEKLSVNAAIISGICEFYNGRLSQHFYICDGERNVVHKTAFQDYLIKYFGFRKAYCKLNIAYRPMIGIVVKCLYPIRGMLKKINSTRLGAKVNAVLLMEEISRKDK